MAKTYAPGKTSSFRPPLTPTMSTSPPSFTPTMLSPLQPKTQSIGDLLNGESLESSRIKHVQQPLRQDCDLFLNSSNAPQRRISNPILAPEHADFEYKSDVSAEMAVSNKTISSVYHNSPRLTKLRLMRSWGASTPQDVDDLAKAFNALGLASGASLSEDLIAGVFQARLKDSPAQKQRLIECLRTIAEFQSSRFLKGIIACLDLSDGHIPHESDTLRGKKESPVPELVNVGTLGEPEIRWFVRKDDQFHVPQGHEKKLQPAVRLSQNDDSPNLDAQHAHPKTTQLEQCEKPPVGYNLSTTTESAPFQLEGSSKPSSQVDAANDQWKLEDGNHSSLEGDDGEAYQNDNLNVEEHTVDNPKIWQVAFFENNIVEVTVSDDLYNYTKLFVNKSIMLELLHHKDFNLQREEMCTAGSISFTGISPYPFVELLKLLYQDDHIRSLVLTNLFLDSYLHSGLYHVARKFHFSSIAEQVLQILAREENFAQFLYGAKQFYKFDDNDHALRSFFKNHVKAALADPLYAWEGSIKNCDWITSRALLQDAFAIPSFGSDVYEVLLDREHTLALEQIAAATPPSFIEAGEETDTEEANSGELNDGWCNNYEPKLGHFSNSDDLQMNLEGEKPKGSPDSAPKPDEFHDDKTVFVRGFPLETTAKEVGDFFQAFGEVVEVSLLHAIVKGWVVFGAKIRFAHPSANLSCRETISYGKGCVLVQDAGFYDHHGIAPTVVDTYATQSGAYSSQDGLKVTATAIKTSNDQDCTVSFRTGDQLVDVTVMAVPPRSTVDSKIPVPILSGTCKGVSGTFPTSYVRFNIGDEGANEVQNLGENRNGDIGVSDNGWGHSYTDARGTIDHSRVNQAGFGWDWS